MNSYNYFRINIWFVFFSFLIPSLINSAEIDAQNFLISDHAFLSLVAYNNSVYCYSKTSLYIINNAQKTSRISLPSNPDIIEISPSLSLARLPDDIILLLDRSKKKIIKIHGGLHNSSPRTKPETFEIKKYIFSFEIEKSTLRVLVKHAGEQWRRTCRISGIRREQSLILDDKNYSVRRNSLYIKDKFKEEQIIIGNGVRLPVTLSKSRKLLAIEARSENAIKIFDANSNSIISVLKVGNLAYPPVHINHMLFATWYNEKAVYRYDLSELFGHSPKNPRKE